MLVCSCVFPSRIMVINVLDSCFVILCVWKDWKVWNRPDKRPEDMTFDCKGVQMKLDIWWRQQCHISYSSWWFKHEICLCLGLWMTESLHPRSWFNLGSPAVPRRSQITDPCHLLVLYFWWLLYREPHRLHKSSEK